MSRVIEHLCNGEKQVCIQDSDFDMIFMDWEDWEFLQSVYGLSADTECLLTRVREILHSASDSDSRLVHEW